MKVIFFNGKQKNYKNDKGLSKSGMCGCERMERQCLNRRYLREGDSEEMKETEKCKKMGIHNYFLNRHFFPL
jgi:hypothetical protein